MLLTAPLRRRDFRLLWTGMTVSLLGDGVFLVAVAWLAYSLSNDPSSVAFIGIATSLPQVVLLLGGGVVSDRASRRTLLLWADIARAVAVGALAALVALGDVRLWQLYVVGAVIGTATAFSSPAFDAFVPQLVDKTELTQANAIEQFVRPFTLQLAGPALGGLTVAVLATWGAFAFDAFTFAFSAFCAWRMAPIAGFASPSSGAAAGGSPRTTLLAEVREGLRYVRGRVWLWGTFLSATLTYLLFLGPTQVLLPYVVRNSLHDPASTYGLVLAVGGAGALVGALTCGVRPHPRRPVLWVYLWWTLATVAVAGYGLARNAPGLASAAVVVNGAEAVGTVIWATVKQKRVPNSMLGRVSSIDWCISTALLPLSYALTVPVAHALGARTTLMAAGLVGAVTTLGFVFLPGMVADKEVRVTSAALDEAVASEPLR